MVTIQVLDKNHYVQTQCDDNRVDLSIISKISLLPPARKQYEEKDTGSLLAWR